MKLLRALATLATAGLAGCGTSTSDIRGVDDFDVSRYCGRWYEIARLPNSFEEGLTDISAEYASGEEGRISVVNSGWNPEEGVWKRAEGTAKFTGDPRVAELKVTFFWPFYGGYKVVELDRENYAWALVAGQTFDYLWILAREPVLDAAVEARLLDRARVLGFDLSGLIRVPHGVAR